MQWTLNQSKILVVGDVMLDRYWSGNTQRISPEAPIPIVNINEMQHRLGGAAHVAHSIVAMGSAATLLGLIGEDKAGEQILSLCQQEGIQSDLIPTEHPTTEKLRILSQHQQMLRTDFEKIWPAAQHQTELLTRYRKHLADVDVVLLSDYAKATLSDPQAFIQQARAQNKTVIADQRGKIEQYTQADIVIMPAAEFSKNLAKNTQKKLQQLAIKAIIVTAGKQGMTLYEQQADPIHIPVVEQEIYDITGARDTVSAFVALSVAHGYSLKDSVHIANTAARITLTKLGAATVSPLELHLALDGAWSAVARNKICLTLAQALQVVNQAKQQRQKVVMTNGCFDILHIGHAGYLHSAKQLGDRLLIAMNTDASVKRQGKGEGRPFFPLADRMQVMASIGVVDWVLPFDEDTPEQLVQTLQPDVLVKGPDYTLEQIKGADLVHSYGGELMIVGPYAQGHSSSKIIAHMEEASQEQIKDEW